MYSILSFACFRKVVLFCLKKIVPRNQFKNTEIFFWIIVVSSSFAWKYYIRGVDNKAPSECNLCHRLTKHSGNTTNLISHLKNKHPSVYHQEMIAKAKKGKNKLVSNSKRSRQTDSEIVSILQLDIPQFFYWRGWFPLIIKLEIKMCNQFLKIQIY